jgi:hypothetical protein
MRKTTNQSCESTCMTSHSEQSTFAECIAWKHWIVIGIGHHLYLVPLTADNPSTLDLDDYFGHLYSLDHCLLVASGQRLFCVSTNGIVKWSSPVLGIDGVVVSRVWDGIIDGEGEWDPPGGWKAFRITLDSGSPLLKCNSASLGSRHGGQPR